MGTMGESHCENLVGAIIPSACNLSSSAATLSLSANGTCRALRNRGIQWVLKQQDVYVAL